MGWTAGRPSPEYGAWPCYPSARSTALAAPPRARQEDIRPVAKRTRGVTPTSAYRPGRTPTTSKGTSLPSTSSSPRPGTQPPAAIPGAAPRPTEFESSVVLADGATGQPDLTAAGLPVPTVRSHQRGHVKVKPGSALAARAAQEYVYVGEDLRHILKVAVTLMVVMIALWLIIVVANVFGLY